MQPSLRGSRKWLFAIAAWTIFVRQAAAQGDADDRADPVSTSLVIINGFLVFFMQVGFLAYETGSGRAKNVRNILLKNLLDVMLAAIVWWAVGYAFAYGRSAQGVVGTNLFFYEGHFSIEKSTRPWFFSWTFCIASCTIISGCLAERTALAAYPVATLVISGVVHPLLVHWLWSPNGWMRNVSECPVLDFAGGMVVHMLGGLFGLLGAWKCGPRLGRFELADSVDFEGQEAGTVDSASDLAGVDMSGTGPGTAAVDGGHMSWEQYLSVRASSLPSSNAAAANDSLAGTSAAAAFPVEAGCSSSFPRLPGGGKSVMLPMQAASEPLPMIDASQAADRSKKPAECVSAAAVAAAASPLGYEGSNQQPSSLKNSIGDKWQKVKRFGVSSRFAGAGRAAGNMIQRKGKKPGTCGVCQYMPKPMPGHDMAFVTLGTFMLWFGWFGFNNGSVYSYISGSSAVGGMANVLSAEVVQRTSMNTALGGASGGLTALFVAAIFSVVCSGIAGALYTGSSQLLLRCGIDDPLDSSTVHLGNGLLGTILLAFFAKPEHVMALTGSPCGGVFYSSSGWLQLGLQLLGVVVVIVFAGGCAWIMFIVLDRYGLLRIDQVSELAGIDNMDHGGPAYPEFTNSSFIASAAQNPASAGRRMLQ